MFASSEAHPQSTFFSRCSLPHLRHTRMRESFSADARLPLLRHTRFQVKDSECANLRRRNDLRWSWHRGQPSKDRPAYAMSSALAAGMIQGKPKLSSRSESRADYSVYG